MADLTVVRPAPPSAIERLVDDYLMACRARGLSPNTIETSYGYPLRGVFLPWCAERGVEDLAHLDSRAVDAFAVHLLEHPGHRGRPLSVGECPRLLPGGARLSHLVRAGGREGDRSPAAAQAAAPSA